MRRPGRPEGGRLWRREAEGRVILFTEALGRPAAVHREMTVSRDSRTFRQWEPSRSKLAAAIVLGYRGRLPQDDERWLYLGAATGTTASHVADLVGPEGRVYAVERSVRPFARLLRLSERYPNLLPILADARDVGAYLGFVPPVDGLYIDVAQADQIEIAEENARWLLRGRGTLLMALKTPSMGRDLDAAGHRSRAVEKLGESWEVERPLDLAPLHRGHYWIEARATPRLFREPGGARAGPVR